MNDEVGKRLADIAAQGDLELLKDTRRLKSLLLDLCGAYRMEVNLLILAQQEGIADALLNSRLAGNANVRQVWRTNLQNNLGMTEQSAAWAVEAWATALGLPALGLPAPIAASTDAPEQENSIASAATTSGAASGVAAQSATAQASMPSGSLASVSVSGAGPAGSRKKWIAGLSAAAVVLVASFVIWLMNEDAATKGRAGDSVSAASTASGQEASSVTPSVTTADKSTGSIGDGGQLAEDAKLAVSPPIAPAYEETDYKAAYPDRYFVDSVKIEFDNHAYQIVFGATEGDTVGDWAGSLFVSEFQYDAELKSWHEMWSSKELMTGYEPNSTGDYALIGGIHVLQPKGGNLGAVVFDILNSGSSGGGDIYMLKVSKSGQIEFVQDAADNDSLSNGYFVDEHQSEDQIVAETWNGGQLLMRLEGDQFIVSSKSRSEVYPSDAIKVPIKADEDGTLQVVGKSQMTMQVGDTFVFSPVDEKTKRLFNETSIYTDESMAHFSNLSSSFDTLDETGTFIYILNNDGTPTLTITAVAS